MNIDGLETDNLSYSELLELRDYYCGTIYYHVFERAINERASYNHNNMRCTTRKKRKFSLCRPKFAHTKYIK